jgi:hypothetical protein
MVVVPSGMRRGVSGGTRISVEVELPLKVKGQFGLTLQSG